MYLFLKDGQFQIMDQLLQGLDRFLQKNQILVKTKRIQSHNYFHRFERLDKLTTLTSESESSKEGLSSSFTIVKISPSPHLLDRDLL